MKVTDLRNGDRIDGVWVNSAEHVDQYVIVQLAGRDSTGKILRYWYFDTELVEIER